MLGGLEVGLDKMRGDSGAAEKALEAQEALARIRLVVERYARAKVGAFILGREIERYRQENQGPMLTKASQLFARLTLGRYTGVRAGYNDKDKPALKCVRDGNVEVDVEGLSEGTRDQLYLSLRLASLLRYADLAEPMPLVLDDVLIQFDDERSRAALQIIAELSTRMQVLFFTHHTRLVELARAAVPPSSLTVHELTSAPAVAVTCAAAGLSSRSARARSCFPAGHDFPPGDRADAREVRPRGLQSVEPVDDRQVRENVRSRSIQPVAYFQSGEGHPPAPTLELVNRLTTAHGASRGRASALRYERAPLTAAELALACLYGVRRGAHARNPAGSESASASRRQHASCILFVVETRPASRLGQWKFVSRRAWALAPRRAVFVGPDAVATVRLTGTATGTGTVMAPAVPVAWPWSRA